MLIDSSLNKENCFEETGFSKLEYAIKKKDYLEVRSIITSGYDPRSISASGLYPIATAVCYGSLEALSLIASYCADFEPPDPYLNSPLQHANICGHSEILNYPISHGADLDALQNGDTPLTLSCRTGNSRLGLSLIAAGANKFSMNSEKENCLQILQTSGDYVGLSQFSENYSFFYFLRSLKLPKNIEDAAKLSAIILRLAAKRFNRSIHIDARLDSPTSFMSCVEHNHQHPNLFEIDRLRCNQCKSSIFHLAVKHGDFEILQRLISDKKIKRLINLSDIALDRPLHIAIKTHKHEFIKPLFMGGADINACNRDGLTPLHLAILDGNLIAVESLLSLTANVFLKPRNNLEAEKGILKSFENNPNIRFAVEAAFERNHGNSIFSENNPFAIFIRRKNL